MRGEEEEEDDGDDDEEEEEEDDEEEEEEEEGEAEDAFEEQLCPNLRLIFRLTSSARRCRPCGCAPPCSWRPSWRRAAGVCGEEQLGRRCSAKLTSRTDGVGFSYDRCQPDCLRVARCSSAALKNNANFFVLRTRWAKIEKCKVA